MIIAFLAPIKPPDHPIPSGDRLIAQNLIKALKQSGHVVDLASRYISYSKRSDKETLEERKAGALAEADRLIEKYSSTPEDLLPKIWITYHPYCKAPDWIGPIVAKKFGIPYITIEAARTAQGAKTDEWAEWRMEAQAGIRQADRHIVLKPTDHSYLSELLGSTEKLFDLAPFMDTSNNQLAIPFPLPKHWKPDAPVLITTGMMRKGKKDRNFHFLADALSKLKGMKWNLIVVGGGPEEENIKKAFSLIPSDRMQWTGEIPHSDVLRWMRSSDIFIWPGWKEPIGMVYLEAQLQELPVVAFHSMGVPTVVQKEETGLLSREGDVEALQENIARLLAAIDLRLEMGGTARRHVLENHGLDKAATRLNEILNFD